MENLKDINEKIDKIIVNKKLLVDELIAVLELTNDSQIRKIVTLALIDNFKDDKIIPTLMRLIKRSDLKNHNAILVFALGEYCDCKDYLDFFVDLLLYYDYHVAFNSFNILINMPPPFDNLILSKVYKRIKDNISLVENDKEGMIRELLALWDNYL